jgi:putative ABC transport system substrate-binding protein
MLSLSLLPRFSVAQERTKIPRIGYLAASGDPMTPGPLVEAFRQGLRDLGYEEGRNILIEYRYAQGDLDRVPELVKEIVRLKPDAFVSGNLAAIRAAKQATRTIPIVMILSVDPVGNGIVASLARPGGNITGLTRLTRELNGKRLELLKEMLPKIARVGLVRDASAPSSSGLALSEYQTAAAALNIKLQSLDVHGSNPDLDGAFQTAMDAHVSALIIVRDALFNRYAKRIADLAAKNRLPSMYEGTEYIDAGGLVSYAANDADQYRRAAVYVVKILGGAKPADLPVEQPTKFELVINLKTAKQIGLTIPPNVLARADKVIK